MNFSELLKDYNFLTIFIIILLIALVFQILLLVKRKQLALNLFWASISIYLSAASLILCFASCKIGICYIKTSGNPAIVVESFYSSIIKEDYETAYSYLNDCSSLGFEDPKEDNNESAINLKISNALKYSYSYNISTDSSQFSQNQLTASVPVEFTYLDLTLLESSIESNIDEILNEKIQELPKSELYTDDGHYKKTLMDSVYDEAVDKSLKHVKDYYTIISYDINLNYDKGNWFINTNDQMIKGFLGGQ